METMTFDIIMNGLGILAQAATDVGALPAPTQVTPRLNILQGLLLLVYFTTCVGLIVCVLLQTTKSEGLSGVIGGSTQAIFKGKKSVEEKLNQITTWLAVGFVSLSLLVALFAFRH
jgi:preprotein translocase subunit SecG